MMFPLRGGTVVLTGAASGIGAALAARLAAGGANLALADRNGEGLSAVADAARAQGVRVSEHVVDLADRAALEALPDRVLNRHDRVNVLINNAGVALGGAFAELSMGDFEWLFEINFWAPVRLTRAFMCALAREPAAHIVNMSSLFGLIAPPGQSAYAAAKFALRGFSESLRHELAGGPVSLTVVHPGGVRTAIAENARMPQAMDPERSRRLTQGFNKMLRTPPEVAAGLIVRAIERREKRLLIGRDARVAEAIQRLFPVQYWRHIERSSARG